MKTYLLALVLLAGCSEEETDPPDVVTTSLGKVRGVMDGDLLSFRGIPYAAPPTGDRRFAHPEDAEHWDGIRDGSQFGNVCLQPDSFTGNTQRFVGSEDCLSINIWTPDTHPDKPLPVLFYIHGGGYFIGSGSGLETGAPTVRVDGLLKDGPAVVVTFNYRLGILGFLAHKGLAAQSGYGGSGNYGFMDQIQALEWVQRNIKAFGGDPLKVSVFGLSAGGGSASVLVASPSARSLFSSALFESSSPYTMSQATAEAQGDRIAHAASCDTAADVVKCLRAIDATALAKSFSLSYQAGVGQGYFGPTVDHAVLPDRILAIYQRGEQNHVPIIVGTASEEFSWVIYGIFPTPPTNDAEYRAAVEAAFGAEAAPALVQLYPPASYPTPRDALVAIYTDFVYTCPGRAMTRALARSQKEPVRRYIYTHTFHGGDYVPYHAGHGFDDAVLWDAYHPLDADEQAMGSKMRQHLLRLADTSAVKGGSDAPWDDWPTYDPIADSYLAIDTPMSQAAAYRSALCDQWDPYIDAN